MNVNSWNTHKINMNISQRLYQVAKPKWQECIDHPFVRGIADASLPLEKYQYYTIQDDLYIVSYTKPYAYGVIKSQSEQDVRDFAMKVPVMMECENDMHQKYLHDIGITDEMIRSSSMNLVNISYTNYMISVAAMGGIAEIAAAVLPCSWCYEQIGEFMEEHAAEKAKKSPVFGPWIATYTDASFREMNQQLINIIDRSTKNASEDQIQNLETIVLNCSTYEKLFWDAAWNMK